MRHNFNKCKRCVTQNHPYDYDSVMHYPNTAFGNGRITIARKGCGANTSGQCRLGQTNGFSEWDIKGLNLLYKCSDTGGGGGGTGGDCRDKNSNCPRWKNEGYCKGRYEEWMTSNCAKSCNTCGCK